MAEENRDNSGVNRLEELDLDIGKVISLAVKQNDGSSVEKKFVLTSLDGFGDGGVIGNFNEMGRAYQDYQSIHLNRLRKTPSGNYELTQ